MVDGTVYWCTRCLSCIMINNSLNIYEQNNVTSSHIAIFYPKKTSELTISGYTIFVGNPKSKSSRPTTFFIKILDFVSVCFCCCSCDVFCSFLVLMMVSLKYDLHISSFSSSSSFSPNLIIISKTHIHTMYQSDQC